MSGNVKLASAGGGSVTLDTPSTASNYTVTLPAATSTLIDTTSTQTLTNKTLTAAGSNTVEATSGPTSTQLAGMRNKIINGAMMIDQRNAGASVTPTANLSYQSCDRWQAILSQSSKFSLQRNAGAVTPPAGFSSYLGLTSLSSYTVGAGETFGLNHQIEGYNIADLAWGTANAKTVTLSFWVRSSLTGTFGGVITNSSNNRTYPFTYSISSANTWTQISITIPGDTTGTWATDNTSGLWILFGVGCGASASGPAGAWAGTAYYSATGATSVVGTNGATWYVTGVQLEKGATATPFENRLYGTELALCQRYYYRLVSGNSQYVGTNNNWNTTQGQSVVSFPVSMRTAPSLDANSGTSYWRIDAAGSNFNTSGAWTIYFPSVNAALVYSSTFTGLTAGQAGTLYSNNASAYMGFTAEL